MVFFISFATPMILVLYLISYIPRRFTRNKPAYISLLSELLTTGLLTIYMAYNSHIPNYYLEYTTIWIITVIIIYMFHYMGKLKNYELYNVKRRNDDEL